MSASQLGEAVAIAMGVGSSICVALLNIGFKLFRIARALEKLADDE